MVHFLNTKLKFIFSSVDFRKLVIEQTNNDGDVDWEKLLPFNTAKDLFAVLTANEIRMLRDTNPNVKLIIYVFLHSHKTGTRLTLLQGN